MASNSFDWKSLQKFLNPEAANDFSRFMDQMPVHAGKGALIAAGIAWAAVAALGLFTVMQSKELTELRASLQTSEAVKPLVPVISMTPVSGPEITKVVTQFKTLYPGMSVTGGNGTISIKSKQTADFAQFRESLGQVVNSGKGWRVTVDAMCVGRECKESGLNATLKVQKLKIDKPTS